MPEGEDYISFIKVGNTTRTRIDSAKADENYQFWVNKLGIAGDPESDFPDTFAKVTGLFGNHTFPFKVHLGEDKYEHPIRELLDNLDHSNVNKGLQSSKKRGVPGAYMDTATELGLNNLIFSYLGVHDPYHRQQDPPPVMPFGFFLEAGPFAFTHGNPWDRDYITNKTKVDPGELEYYFLNHHELKKIVTWRIENDPLFEKDFWRYYGTATLWNQGDYLEDHWKNKAELCFYETVPIQYIRAILWPVWEEGVVNDEFTMNDMYDFAFDVKKQYKSVYGKDLHIVFYHPYGNPTVESNWNTMNQRDPMLNMVNASQAVQEYYQQHNDFPQRV